MKPAPTPRPSDGRSLNQEWYRRFKARQCQWGYRARLCVLSSLVGSGITTGVLVYLKHGSLAEMLLCSFLVPLTGLSVFMTLNAMLEVIREWLDEGRQRDRERAERNNNTP